MLDRQVGIQTSICIHVGTNVIKSNYYHLVILSLYVNDKAGVNSKGINDRLLAKGLYSSKYNSLITR